MRNVLGLLSEISEPIRALSSISLPGNPNIRVDFQTRTCLSWANYVTGHDKIPLVDKTGCLSFRSIPWEAGQDLIGMNVDVAFRPDNPHEIEVFHKGFEPRKIKPLTITEYSAPRKRIPLPQKEAPPTSRELDAAQKQYKKHQGLYETAISYRSVIGGKDRD